MTSKIAEFFSATFCNISARKKSFHLKLKKKVLFDTPYSVLCEKNTVWYLLPLTAGCLKLRTDTSINDISGVYKMAKKRSGVRGREGR